MMYVYRYHWKRPVEILIVMASGEENWDLSMQIRAGKRETLFHCISFTISSLPHPSSSPGFEHILLFNN